jgi:hypothetical protein
MSRVPEIQMNPSIDKYHKCTNISESAQSGLRYISEGRSNMQGTMRSVNTWSVLVVLALVSLVMLLASSANAAEVNRGACMRDLEPAFARYQAPGQTGNGPLVIVNGRLIVPDAFEGGFGCTR